MLAKRIIPCLDIKNGRTVKGTNFVNLADAGDPVELASIYSECGADELVFLDITATVENRSTFYASVKQIAQKINIPFTVGGGIKNIDDVEKLLESGADKISINSAAVNNPKIIGELAKRFGSQCIVAAIDVNKHNNSMKVFTHGGRKATEMEAAEYAKIVYNEGAGEILLTSMLHDGTRNGFDCQFTRLISESVTIPVIASGGAGKPEHFSEVFTEGKADAALAAGIFHFNVITISELKQYLHKQNISIR